MPSVKKARVNWVTRSVLVYFDSKETWQRVADKIAAGLETALADELNSVKRAGDAAKLDPMALTLPAISCDGVSHEWHRLPPDCIPALTDTNLESGLDQKSADYRKQLHGPNKIRSPQLRRRMQTFRDQCWSLPIALLLAESVVIFLGGAVIEAALLTVIMAVNVTAGYLVDRRAEQVIAAFRHRPRPTAQVLRGGAWVDVPGEDLVMGDVLKLMPTTFVGADARIIASSHLKIDESILTGESHPVDKHAYAIGERSPHLFDQRNMAFMGTLVVGGEGLAVVVATGERTEYGKLSELFDETSPPKTPIVAKTQALSESLLKVALGLSVGVLAFGLVQGRGLLQAMGRALSIAAGGIPAGLPSAAVVNIALGYQRLRRNQISIRRPTSLESLSAIQMVCFDKTGTLTRGRIDVQQIHCSGNIIHVHRRVCWLSQRPFVLTENSDTRRLLEACVLCSESKIRMDETTHRQQITGSPTEVALLHLAAMAGFDIKGTYRRYALLKVEHRDDTRRYMMTTYGTMDSRAIIFIKGDPSEVIDMCGWELINGRRIRLSEDAKNAIDIQNQRMSSEALRVLGFAYANLNAPSSTNARSHNLTWIGMVGMAEPIRKGVGKLIEKLHLAGIQTAMITGDQATTATAVARKIRLSGTSDIRIFDSSRFDTLSPELAKALIRDVHVFARVNPAQKLQIIQAYQGRGMVVAMTGDGINDGPALRAADVGIAMGLSGTEPARDVADMVLERDNITSVATAIYEGRAAYRNLKRALRYFIATNFSDILLTSAAATIAGDALLTFRPVQVALLTDLTPGLALLTEPARPSIDQETPRDREQPLFSGRDMFDMFSESAVLAGGGLAAFAYGLLRYGPGALAGTLAYETLSASKLLHAVTCRPLVPDGSKKTSNPANVLLNMALGAALVAQAGTILIPSLRRLLNIAPLKLSDMAVISMASWATHRINREIREKRRLGGVIGKSKPESIARS